MEYVHQEFKTNEVIFNTESIKNQVSTNKHR